jgi:DNA-binding PadR family transcriptional regulator
MYSKKQPKLRPHETQQILKILKTLKKNSKNTLAIYRELHQNTGFRNHHSFYRQLHFCLDNRLIELESIEKRWGIPTKKYRLTPQGQEMLTVLAATLQPSKL